MIEKELPEGWERLPLEELFMFVIGGDWGQDPEKILDGEYKEVICIRGSEIKNWKRDKGASAAIRKIKAGSLEKRELQVGDILLEISGGGPEQPVGRTVIIDEETLSLNSDLPKICSNFLRLIRLTELINKNYINYFLQFFYQTGEIVNYQAGSNNLRNLKFNDYCTIEVPLPPLAEQHRIVAKLNAAFAHIDTVKAKLERIPELLKNFRQAVLTQAVTGKLTEEWREKHPNISSATELIDSIIEDRIKWYNCECKKRSKSKPRKPKFEVDYSKDELSYLHLPLSWEITFVEEIAAPKENALKAGPFGSSLKKEFYAPSGYKIYGQEQVIRGDIHYGDYYIDERKYKELESCKIEAEDILISLVGTIGKVLIVPKDFEPGIINPRLLKFSLHHSIIKEFIKVYLDSEVAKKVLDKGSHGGTMEILNLEMLKTLPIPLPPIEEQQEIVKRVEVLFAKADIIETQYLSLKEKWDKLPQALLSKAFSGKLVAQDASDEPAAMLLERIQQAKAARNATKGKGKHYTMDVDSAPLRVVAEE